MADRKPLAPPRSAQAVARAAGIGSTRPLTLSEVNRRRTQLWSVALFVLTAVLGLVVLYWASYDLLPRSLQLGDVSGYVVMVLAGGFVLAFLLYVADKESRLRGLTMMLVEERVLSSALSNRLSEISALSEVGKALNTTLDLADVLNLILTSALELLGATEGSIMLLEDDNQRLRVVSCIGPRFETIMQGRGQVGEGIAGTVAASRRPMLIQEGRIQASLKDSTHPERHIHSAMCVPLVRNEDLLGVLNLTETEGRRTFTDQDLNALGLFAEHAAIAIGNASLFEKERETVARLEELDQLKSDFVASVSHELKTPLTAIIGAAKTVSRKGADMGPDQHAAFLEMIERQGQRLLRLVEDVLTTAQIESGQAKVARELLDLESLAGDVKEDLLAAKVGAGREIVIECDPEKPQAWGDQVALHHVLSNLVENALKYSDVSTRIVIRVIETPEEARFEVEDEGAGISQEKLDYIFERFQQVDSSSTRRVGGFGLGLFIVKKLVHAQGGKIEVKSTPGVGSVFTVRFPKRSSDRGRLLGDN